MLYRIKRLYRPEFYQGPRSPRPYFEGWFFKLATPTMAMALIPGISLAPKDPHAFIQLNLGSAGGIEYHRFPVEEFSFARDNFSIGFGDNHFSLERVRVSADGFFCDLSISGISSWPSTLFSPGTMGWYSFVPLMECNHAIVAMDGEFSGVINGRPIRGGRLYIEKDWGRSFPSGWVWSQSNSFDTPGTSLSCSVANVPFIGGAFTGFLIGFLHDGRLHRFTTYTGARLQSVAVSEREVQILVSDRHASLRMTARRTDGVSLASPLDGEMVGRIEETLSSEIDVELSIRGETVFAGRGRQAGLEVVNPVVL